MKIFALVTMIFCFCFHAIGEEFYDARPSIDVIEARPFSKAKSIDQWVNWTTKEKRGLLHFIALQRVFYPNSDRYYLARDAENIYDLEMSLLKNQPEERKRIHLLNISRKHVKGNKPLLEYLTQEGLHEPGRKVFIDTAFLGSILKRIKSKYPLQFDHIDQHLINSGNTNVPQSNIFWAEMDTDKIYRPDIVRTFEQYPHYTQSSDNYQLINGRYVPSSSIKQDPTIKKNAISVMADIKSFANQAGTREYFEGLVHKLNVTLEQIRNRDFKLENSILPKHTVIPFLQDVQDAWRAGNIQIEEVAMEKLLYQLPKDVLIEETPKDILKTRKHNLHIRQNGYSKTMKCFERFFYFLKDLND